MERLSSDRVTVSARKTPLLFSKKCLYRLSDFTYGEWIIFENSMPKYYFNVHEEQYSQIRDQLKPNVESYLTERFKKKGLSLSLREKAIGIPLPSKSEIIKLDLEKLPLEIIS